MTSIEYNPDEALRLDNQLCFPLYAAARKVTGAYTPFLKPLGLTYTQYLVMMVLWEKDHVPVSFICGRLHLDNGTVTPLLKKMEAAGFICRTRSREDERSVFITLTDEGRALKTKAAEVPRKVGGCLDIAPEDARVLYDLLYKVLNS